jgi:hypothetical protein
VLPSLILHDGGWPFLVGQRLWFPQMRALLINHPDWCVWLSNAGVGFHILPPNSGDQSAVRVPSKPAITLSNSIWVLGNVQHCHTESVSSNLTVSVTWEMTALDVSSVCHPTRLVMSWSPLSFFSNGMLEATTMSHCGRRLPVVSNSM